MLTKLKPKSEFSRNVLTLMTGTTIAQAIPIAISPILTRIYTPEDFGVFALFVAISSIFASIANGSYEYAIMLPKKDEDAINIFALGFMINLVISTTILAAILFLHDSILEWLNNKDIGIWLYFIPLVVFLTGFFNLLNYFNNRLEKYKDIAKVNVYRSIVLAIVQLSIGFLKTGVTGLISGQIVSQMAANTKLFYNIKNLRLFYKIKRIKMLALGRRYKRFFIYTSLSNLLNSFSYQIVNILIPTLFTLSILGYYFLVQRMFGLVTRVLASSLSQVFLREAISEKNLTGKSAKSFNYIFYRLLMISIPVSTILFIWVEDIFIMVFGEKWRIAGEFAKILIPFFAVRFISSVLSNLLIVFEKQKMELLINVIIIFSSISILLVFKDNFKDYLLVYSFTMSMIYLLFLFYYYKLAYLGVEK